MRQSRQTTTGLLLNSCACSVCFQLLLHVACCQRQYNNLAPYLLDNQTLRISFFLFSIPYLMLVYCYKDPRALRRHHGQHVPTLWVSSPPVRCFFSESSYIIFYLTEHFESCRTCVLLTCKSCALNLRHTGDPRRLTFSFTDVFLIFCSTKWLQGRVTRTLLEIIQCLIFAL